jgi:hypothetical protein
MWLAATCFGVSAVGSMKLGKRVLFDREVYTIQAALRYWQRSGLVLEDVLTAEPEWDIATNGGQSMALDDLDIDLLCEEITFYNKEPDSIEVATLGMIFQSWYNRFDGAEDFAPDDVVLDIAQKCGITLEIPKEVEQS